MNKLVFFLSIFLFNLSITACISSINLNNKLLKNNKITLEKQDSIICIEENKNISDQDELQKDILIENLPNGNYRFCSEPASEQNITGFDEESWCFEFNKTDNFIVGTYSYQAPKDTAQICIEGLAKDNRVNGIGYELVQYGAIKPDIEQEKLKISQNTSFMSKRDYWDDTDIYQGGFNLKVKCPHFHKLIEPEQEGNGYWAWVRFDKAELNLSEFYQRELRKNSYQGKLQEVIPASNCIN